MSPNRAVEANSSLTLERGLRVLRVLAAHPDGLSISELASKLETHRAGIYRLLGPLIANRFVVRADDGRHSLGVGLLELASRVKPRLQEVAIPVLRRLADELRATTALTVRDGNEAVVAAVIEPRSADLHVSYRTGLRHAIDVAASGLAILAASPALAGERAEVTDARRRGWARSHGELLLGTSGVGVAIVGPEGMADSSISAVWVGERDEEEAARLVVQAAAEIANNLR